MSYRQDLIGCYHSAYPKAPALLEPHHQIVYYHIQNICWGLVLHLCRDAVGVFLSHGEFGFHFLGKACLSFEFFSFLLFTFISLLPEIIHYSFCILPLSISVSLSFSFPLSLSLSRHFSLPFFVSLSLSLFLSHRFFLRHSLSFNWLFVLFLHFFPFSFAHTPKLFFFLHLFFSYPVSWYLINHFCRVVRPPRS